MEHHLVEDGAELVATAILGHVERALDGLRDGSAQRTRTVSLVSIHPPSHLSRLGGGGRHVGAEGLHHAAAEGLLLEGRPHHEHVAVKAKVRGCLRERGSPLTGARLGGDGRKTLLTGVVRLGKSRVELVGAGGVVTLELEVYSRGRVEGPLEVVGPT